MYCTQQMIRGENFCDRLKYCKNRESFPLESFAIYSTVFVKVQPKFKPDHNYHEPYRVHEATDTNVKVKPISSPDVEYKIISLQQVSKCKGNFSF